jgi:ABC-type uncharacterized transport system involved in gliding motility auxiliary subunit
MAVSKRRTMGRWGTLVVAAAGAVALVLDAVPTWVAWIVLLVSGAACALLWGFARALERRSVQWVGTLGFVAIVLVLVNILGSRNSLRLDLTREKRHTLSQETLQLLGQLEGPVRFVAFPEGGASQRLEDLFKEYSHASSHVSYRLVDPDRKPAAAREYGISAYGAVVVEAMGSREQLDDVSESTLTNALARLLSQDRATVTFLVGHGEHSPEDTERSGASFAREVLESRNLDVSTSVMALDDSALTGADVIVVAGPQTAPLPQEVETLRDHLRAGGGLLVLVDPSPGASWNELLRAYGVEREDAVLLDENPLGSLFGADRSVPLVSEYGVHPITEGFNLATFFPLASPVRSLSDSLSPAELALGGELTSAVGPDSIPKRPPEGESLVLALALETSSPDSTARAGRLVVVGDSDFATNTFLGLSGNRDFLLNCVQWLAAQEDRIAVRPRAVEGEPLVLTAGTASSIFLLAVIVLPGAALAGGVIVWWRRR